MQYTPGMKLAISDYRAVDVYATVTSYDPIEDVVYVDYVGGGWWSFRPAHVERLYGVREVESFPDGEHI